MWCLGKRYGVALALTPEGALWTNSSQTEVLRPATGNRATGFSNQRDPDFSFIVFGSSNVFDHPCNVFGHLVFQWRLIWPPYSGSLGYRWFMEGIAVKPYACGTITRPYVDCMLDIDKDGVRGDDIVQIVCESDEVLVDRFGEWLVAESAALSHRCGLFQGRRWANPVRQRKDRQSEYRNLAKRMTYVVDPDNEYPRTCTGHVRATLTGGRSVEYRRPPVGPKRVRGTH